MDDWPNWKDGNIIRLILTAALVTACAQALVPETTPAASETPEPTLLTICYVFISEYSEQVGGLPALITNLYIYKDGFLQHTQESNDDTVLAVSEATVQAEGLFARLNAGEYELPPSAPPPGITPGVLPEFAPPSSLVEYGFCDGTFASWTGTQEQLPGVLRELVDTITGLSKTAVLVPITSGGKHLRAQIVEDEKVEEIIRAGLPLEITEDELSNNPILGEALKFPRRLIALPPEAELYVTIPLTFTPGKSAFIMIGGQLFQVRHIVTNS